MKDRDETRRGADERTDRPKADPGSGGELPGLDGLYAERTPPRNLEDRVVDDFRASGVPDRGGPAHTRADGHPLECEAGRGPTGSESERRARWSGRSGLFQAAAALVVFLTGWGLGASTPWATIPAVGGPGAAAGTVDAPAYLMLLWEGPGLEPADDAAAVAEAYAAWARSVAASGISISGEELAAERLLVGADERPSPGSARVGGFFILSAETLDEVQSLAEGHPHVASGGVIEIAPVVRR